MIAIATAKAPTAGCCEQPSTRTFTQIVERVHSGRTGEAYVLNREGVFQTEEVGWNLLEVAPERVGLDETSRGVFTAVAPDASGTKFVWATTWLNDDHWLLVVRQEVGDAFWPLRRATYLGLVILVIGGAAIVLLAVSQTNALIRRMERLDEEKQGLNQQLIVAGRLAEIGEMSAGFAHEINNPLQIIRSEHSLIAAILDDMLERDELPRSADTAEMLDSFRQIRTQVDRCAAVTQGILKFARHTDPTPRAVSLSDFIPEVAAMVGSQGDGRRDRARHRGPGRSAAGARGPRPTAAGRPQPRQQRIRRRRAAARRGRR